jgi:hypothetical protein
VATPWVALGRKIRPSASAPTKAAAQGVLGVEHGARAGAERAVVEVQDRGVEREVVEHGRVNA